MGLQGAKSGEMIRDGQGIGQSLWHGSGADALGFACQELTAPHLQLGGQKQELGRQMAWV